MRGANASNKSETSKCVYTIQSIQNGRNARSDIFITRGRLYVQPRSKGSILLRSFTENLEEMRYKNFCGYVLAWVPPHEFSQLLKTQLQFCVA